MKKAIVIGASSGIGRELAKTLASNGYEVGLMARRVELLKTLQNEIPTKTYFDQLDLLQPMLAIEKVKAMIENMQGLDLIVINSGVGYNNKGLSWEEEKETIEVNVSGFTAIAGMAYNYFLKQGGGHIIGISSVAAIRGSNMAPAYNASKAFMSNYMQGLRQKAFKDHCPIVVTDIQPGYVDTDMIKGSKAFWVASAHEAAQQIYDAIKANKKQAYITKRWRLFGWLMKTLPDCIYFRF
jgi:short-subunit dehydrogenase